VGRLLDSPALAAAMSIEATARARRYRWSITAARLRRLYADLTARRLVECR
jgi:glycosyltransferase involved in cell wall biosynthesis